jgi:hypothetical protein
MTLDSAAGVVGDSPATSPMYVGWALCSPCAAALRKEQRET